ncbi:hypothetical protein PGN35_009135 [Nodosilinea sp. PGN35]|uniref:hypothetical protein n=1 Tax=Nodosilinea sp. PGN35 TaxID=3020489 RepID=UPI0023B341DA|nr:hypothetical protein [Nodosilinea sp. TSF1-S3]MDF0368562.1 hypothetical protein [Nodosilinea sp. TSF1-S3]
MVTPQILRRVGLAVGVGVLVAGATLAPRVTQAEIAQASALPEVWQPASADDQALIWRFVLQSPMGVAALNQLAIEGFISPVCEKTLYTHAEYESFQTLLRVQCPTPRGVSTARAYDEMRVTLNRFEDTIHDFDVERIYTDD